MKLLTPAIKGNSHGTKFGTKPVRQTGKSLQPGPAAAASKATQRTPERAANPGHERVYLLRFFPNATRVCIAGSFNDWDPKASPFRNCGKGRWVAELLLKPGRHEYRLVVDGKWTDDSFAQTRVLNPFGGNNCILVVNIPRNPF